MILQYGAYTHENQEATFTLQKTVIRSDQQIGIGHTSRFVIKGMLKADTPADLTTEIIALETAYGTDGDDFTVFLPDGVTPSAHSIDSSDAIAPGVKIIDLSYPEERGGEYTTYRHYQIVLEADILFAIGAGANLTQYSESLQYIGTGGARKVWREPRTGNPIQQQVSQATTVRAVQQGTAIGRTGYESFPAALFASSLEHLERRVLSQELQQNDRYISRWRYEFEGLSTDFPGF